MRPKSKYTLVASLILVLGVGSVLAEVGAVPAVSTETEEGSGSLSMLLFFAIIAIGISFICSIAEAVLLSVTPSYIGSLEESGSKSAKLLAKLKTNVDKPLAAILSLNTIAHTVGAAGVGAQAGIRWGSQAVGYASAVMTLLILFLSEIIPKTIGAVYWKRLASVTARFVNWLIIIMYPLVWLSELVTKLIAKQKTEVVTREEVVAMAALSLQHGQLQNEESTILQNLFKLRTLMVEDIMTPRTVIIAFPEDLTVAQALQQQGDLPVSRLPIYEKTLDQISGFVIKTDIYLAHARGEQSKKLNELRRPLPTVEASASLLELFDLLLNNRDHIALVVDQFGGTDGLVTMEDMIETLIGREIVDEADKIQDMQVLARKLWKKRAERSLGPEHLGH